MPLRIGMYVNYCLSEVAFFAYFYSFKRPVKKITLSHLLLIKCHRISYKKTFPFKLNQQFDS